MFRTGNLETERLREAVEKGRCLLFKEEKDEVLMNYKDIYKRM
jgi:hypothetical protein